MGTYLTLGIEILLRPLSILKNGKRKNLSDRASKVEQPAAVGYLGHTANVTMILSQLPPLPVRANQASQRRILRSKSQVRGQVWSTTMLLPISYLSSTYSRRSATFCSLSARRSNLAVSQGVSTYRDIPSESINSRDIQSDRVQISLTVLKSGLDPHRVERSGI